MQNFEIGLIVSQANRARPNRVGLIGFPFDTNSSFMRGSALAPQLIREALFSESSNLWSESGIDLGQPEALADLGDVALASEENMMLTIENAITSLLEQALRPLSIGGDHSITYPIIRSISKRYP